MTETNETWMDKLALGFCLGGVVAAVTVAMLGKILGHNFTMLAYGIFVACQLAALVLGLITRSKPLGKTAAISSSVLLLGSLFFLG
jgi:uncharacterized protein YqgC (DUF456 family)